MDYCTPAVPDWLWREGKLGKVFIGLDDEETDKFPYFDWAAGYGPGLCTSPRCCQDSQTYDRYNRNDCVGVCVITDGQFTSRCEPIPKLEYNPSHSRICPCD